MGDSRTFAAIYDPKLNALNLVRLLLATGVIVWHSFPLSGHDIEWWPLRQLLGEVWVDGFFAISGFLIVNSWMRNPNWATYLRARILRIMPAFWTCLVVTALVIAPLTAGVFGPSNAGYVVRNAALWIFQPDIAGSPTGVPYPGAWNGSLWTLAWEFFCYLGVLALGVTGLLRRRATIPVLFAVAMLGAVITTLGVVENAYVVFGSRFGLMFLAGALIWQYQDRVRLTPVWATVAAMVLVLALLLPNYRILAALPVAYLTLAAGALIKRPALRLRNDISYGVYIYAFPAQQVLAIWGAWELGVPVFAVLSVAVTIPLAAASWFAVEKPAMRLIKRHRPAAIA